MKMIQTLKKKMMKRTKYKMKQTIIYNIIYGYQYIRLLSKLSIFDNYETTLYKIKGVNNGNS